MEITNDVHIIGATAARYISVNGETIGSGFTWGVTNSQSRATAHAILLKFVMEQEAEQLSPIFSASVVGLAPQGNFGIRLRLADWMEACRDTSGKQVHSYELFDIYIGDLNGEAVYISKFIDFPNFNCQTANIKPTDYEYDLLKELADDYEKWELYKAYIESKTERQSVYDANVVETASLTFTGTSFLYSNGLGEGLYQPVNVR